MSTLMFWNKQNGNSNNQNGSENGSTGKNGKKTWLHSPESLVNGHVAYLVKVSGTSFQSWFYSHFYSFIKNCLLSSDFFLPLLLLLNINTMWNVHSIQAQFNDQHFNGLFFVNNFFLLRCDQLNFLLRDLKGNGYFSTTLWVRLMLLQRSLTLRFLPLTRYE